MSFVGGHFSQRGRQLIQVQSTHVDSKRLVLKRLKFFETHRPNIYRLRRGVQLRHQRQCVVECAVAGAETGHSVCDNPITVGTDRVESFARHQQRQRLNPTRPKYQS